jgi:hypothetical protein
MKLCENCRHYRQSKIQRPGNTGGYFLRDDCLVLTGTPNPVRGTAPIEYVDAATMRLSGPCGMTGTLFRKKET